MLDVIKIIGEQYIHGEFESENSEYVGKVYRKIAEINKKLFEKIPFEVIFTDDDPYQSAKEMREKVIAENKIYIFKGGSEHEFFTEEENWMGRAVHDVFAHLVCGCPFTFEGEYNSYLEQRKHYPEWTWRVLFAEIPAQTSAYYYKNSFDFDQRAIEAPIEWLEMCYQYKKDFSCNSVLKPIYFN